MGPGSDWLPRSLPLTIGKIEHTVPWQKIVMRDQSCGVQCVMDKLPENILSLAHNYRTVTNKTRVKTRKFHPQRLCCLTIILGYYRKP
jgi:hypothetical protein